MRLRNSESDSAHLHLRYQFFDGVRLLAIPFDVTEPQRAPLAGAGFVECQGTEVVVRDPAVQAAPSMRKRSRESSRPRKPMTRVSPTYETIGALALAAAPSWHPSSKKTMEG